ncbi:MAG: hypothetical protein DLM50_02360 [Candidatus Meridianibacter frigidus]|nr:MAG: hypothetical protein DLM50_02360 [Candidatus Eremiobacteraeota bacterium]
MRSLRVYLNGRPTGTLLETDERRNLFTFDREFVEAPNPPVLSSALLNTAKRPAAPTSTSTRILPFFANVLPEPNSDLRRYLASQVGIDRRDDMGLLRALGQDLPGAATVAYEGGKWDVPSEFDTHQAASERPLRFSLAGVQMKFSATRSSEGTYLVPETGAGGTHIIKLPEPGKPLLPENEFAMMRFAAAVGIDVPALELVTARNVSGLPERFAGFEGHAYTIERFDRGESRIHIEDFAQLLKVYPEDKYERVSFEHLLNLSYRLLGEEGLAECVRRIVFSIAIANADMHLKNWSVRYPDGRTPEFAPAYDYVCTAAFPRYDDFLALPIARTRHWKAISEETVLAAARSVRVPSHVVKKACREMISAVHTQLRIFLETSDVPDDVARVIDRQMHIVPLFATSQMSKRMALSDAEYKRRFFAELESIYGIPRSGITEGWSHHGVSVLLRPSHTGGLTAFLGPKSAPGNQTTAECSELDLLGEDEEPERAASRLSVGALRKYFPQPQKPGFY